MIRPIMPAWPVLILLENRAPMEHSAHLAPSSTTNVQAAEAQIRAEMGFPAALAERDYHPGQSSSCSFYELGEWCICTRCTQQPHDCGTPARVGRFRGTGLQPSGSDQPRGWCLTKSGATSVESGLSRGCRRPSMSARRPSVRRLSVESVESMAMVDGYSTRTLGTTG